MYLFIQHISDIDMELSDEMKMLGYPKKHCHKLVCLRKELLDTFVELVLCIGNLYL